MKNILSIIVIIFTYALLLAVPVQFLWNFALMPAVDGLNYIHFWQALGINLLSSILFKNSTIKNSTDE